MEINIGIQFEQRNIFTKLKSAKMYYEINVAKRMKYGLYVHYFATAKRSLTSKEKTKEMALHFKSIFPEPEYTILVSKNQENQERCSVGIFINDEEDI